jgi:hypothetical protein
MDKTKAGAALTPLRPFVSHKFRRLFFVNPKKAPESASDTPF